MAGYHSSGKLQVSGVLTLAYAFKMLVYQR